MTNDIERKPMPKPDIYWTDHVVRWLRTNRWVSGGYAWFSKRALPMLFALFVAAPIGAVVFVFFIPKFIRNAQRRTRYRVTLAADKLERIAGPPAKPSHGRYRASRRAPPNARPAAD